MVLLLTGGILLHKIKDLQKDLQPVTDKSDLNTWGIS